jgi:hypothetical protein
MVKNSMKGVISHVNKFQNPVNKLHANSFKKAHSAQMNGKKIKSGGCPSKSSMVMAGE